jgi:glutaredoxin/glutathione-dependent peroxiredoxin
MAIKAGERMPAGKFKRMTKEGPKDITTDELFKGKTVVLFSVPGAFTPTCDAKHLPGFVQLADQIRAKGVDTIACMAVNDVFVMNAWGKAQGVGDKVLMLADGNGEYAKALGLELDGSGFGMGMRGQRFAVVVRDGVATRVEVEQPGQFKVSYDRGGPLTAVASTAAVIPLAAPRTMRSAPDPLTMRSGRKHWLPCWR